jgi:hypothetical protein
VRWEKNNNNNNNHFLQVWHYNKWSTPGPDQLVGDEGLFSAYVDEWLKLKAEASGWPPGCETPEQKQAHLDEWEQREGIRLDPELVQKNPGLRQLAVNTPLPLFPLTLSPPLQKAMLNSLWGKLAQRAERAEVVFTTTPRQFHNLLADGSADVMDFTHLNEHLDRVQLRKKAPFVRAPATNALQIACTVTSHARVHLWSAMERIRQAGGRVIYCDTDSAVHVHRVDRPLCVPEGEWLGQLKRECVGRRIIEFSAAGPKNYGLLSVCEETGGDERADMKIRSIELTYEARQMLTYKRMRRLILQHFGTRQRRAHRHMAM